MLDTDRDAARPGPTARAADPRGRGWAGARLLRRTPAPVRVALFIALLAAAAIGLYVAFLRERVPVTPPVVVPWSVIAAASSWPS